MSVKTRTIIVFDTYKRKNNKQYNLDVFIVKTNF